MTLLSPMMTKVQLMAELNLSGQGLDNIRKKHADMPQPIKLGQKLYWRRDDIESWLKNFIPAKRV